MSSTSSKMAAGQLTKIERSIFLATAGSYPYPWI